MFLFLIPVVIRGEKFTCQVVIKDLFSCYTQHSNSTLLLSRSQGSNKKQGLRLPDSWEISLWVILFKKVSLVSTDHLFWTLSVQHQNVIRNRMRDISFYFEKSLQYFCSFLKHTVHIMGAINSKKFLPSLIKRWNETTHHLAHTSWWWGKREEMKQLIQLKFFQKVA